MKKTDFVKYFCNYEILKVDIYYLYDLDTYSYELSTSNIKKNPFKFTDIYIKDDEIFINFLINYCKTNNIPYSFMATISTQNKEKKNFKHSLTKEEIKEKNIQFIVVKQDDKDNISFYKEPLNEDEKINEIQNKLKININSEKQLNKTIELLNEFLDKYYVYQMIKTYNNDDFNVIITLQNNITIIIKGTYLINNLIEYLNIKYEHKKERVIKYE